jgi:hypothetical protein
MFILLLLFLQSPNIALISMTDYRHHHHHHHHHNNHLRRRRHRHRHHIIIIIIIIDKIALEFWEWLVRFPGM